MLQMMVYTIRQVQLSKNYSRAVAEQICPDSMIRTAPALMVSTVAISGFLQMLEDLYGVVK